ncbi:hypothetical protein N7463_001691 [Penicillium fimorum]|uniref:Uncharacterized protein n=1 Tax=Penicillium fimorum TaxID=1882269 RepID=A0A9W9XXM2_9EURO|nr:hypothetical protein N7463_001691 [Penicillium fimorum]
MSLAATQEEHKASVISPVPKRIRVHRKQIARRLLERQVKPYLKCKIGHLTVSGPVHNCRLSIPALSCVSVEGSCHNMVEAIMIQLYSVVEVLDLAPLRKDT